MKRKIYDSPDITAVIMRVEYGFASSNPSGETDPMEYEEL